MIREQIYAALYARISAVQGFKTTSRRLRHWSDVAPSEQPALFMTQRGESATTVPGQPTVWGLGADFYLYAHTGDKDTPPGAILNPLLDDVVSALAPDPITGKQTLGGLVQHAWIEGQIETDEGVLGEQGVAIIPVRIKAI